MLAALLAGAALPASASATSWYQRVLQVYTNTGTVPPCRFTSAELSSALKGVDTYGAQYFSDFTDAIQSALSSRATGACLKQPIVGAASAPPPTSSGPSAPPSSVTAPTSAGVPAPVLLLAIVAGLVALAAGIAALARLGGWDPAWAAAWRHAWSEAGYRVGAGWSDLVDRLRSHG